MNCATIRDRLLASERPDHLGQEDSAHLAGCIACQSWHWRLVRMERHLRKLPMPSCPVPTELLRQIEEVPAVVLFRPSMSTSSPRSELMRRKLALACSLAACLAVFTFAWWAWPPSRPAAAVVMRDSYVELREARLRDAKTAQERLAKLVGLAEDFFDDARKMNGRPERLAQLAGDYDRLMREDLVRIAREVPRAERKLILEPLADQLLRAESEASRLATEWGESTSSDSMRRIALSAREGDRRLRALVRV